MKEFDAKMSYRLDRAVVAAERGSFIGKIAKRLLEWFIFGGRL